MSYLRFATTRFVTLCLSVMVFIPAAPVSAQVTPVLYSELASTLQSLKVTLENYLLLVPNGEVLGAETIVVANDAELAAALQRVTGGETIQLAPGLYGKISINEGQYNKMSVGTITGLKRTKKLTSPVTITSRDASDRAKIVGIVLTSSPYWRIEGLSVRPLPKQVAMQIDSDNVVVTNNDITYGDAEDWDKDDWNTITGNAIMVRFGNDVEVSNNYLKNIDFGIGIGHEANRARVIGNTIDTFNGDAMRGLGDNGLFENNTVMNALQTDGNHSDGFQSWRNYDNNNRPVENVTVRHNTFLGLQNHPLSSKMQGIGLFDGPYKGWVIENNLLILDTYHGINISGAIDSYVRNNVVVDINAVAPNTWMRIANVKTSYTGAPSENSFMENNISTNPLEGSVGVTYTNNKKITMADYDTYFTDYRNNDWSVKAGAVPFSVGAGAVSVAPVPDPEEETNTAPPPSPVPTPVVSNNPTPVTPTPTPTPVPTPTPEPEPEEEPDTKFVSVTLSSTTKVYKTPAGETAGTQKAGARGSYDTLLPFQGGGGFYWVYVNFKTGSDGYINYALLNEGDSKETIEKPVNGTRKAVKSILVTDNVNVRSTPNGSVVAIQRKGAAGTVSTDVAPITKGTHTWVYVDFADGADGYVAVSFTQEQVNNRDALLAQIKILLAQILVLQEKLKQRQTQS